MKTISKTLNIKKKIATVKVKDSYGRTYTVKIEPCYESYEQYGAPTEILWHTLPIAERLARNGFKSI